MFSGDPADLEKDISYELSTLEYLRGVLFGQSENRAGKIEVILGNYAENGCLYTKSTMDIHFNGCENAVRNALSRFQPLAFSAAFKMQDMICEWILRNNSPDKKVPRTFSEKISNYDRLRDSLLEPDLFSFRPNISRAFWETYRKLSKYRNSFIHSGGTVLNGQGGMTISSSKNPLILNFHQQAAYIRVICIVAKKLTNQLENNTYIDAILESGFYFLLEFHGINEIKKREAMLVQLKVVVPQEKLLSENPVKVEINWEELRDTVKRSFTNPESKVEIMISATVDASFNDTVSIWDIPIENVPVSTEILASGDERFDLFLRQRVS